jgi:phenylacetyl-CoA:acceptor oxidoreductase subunit 1
MTRWAMVADLRRCVGCQTCTAACRHANATPPGVQWRRVLDMEFGVYPDVQRAFVPVGCQHCDDPPCLDVCPTHATKKRADGIVTIDYDQCIGCAYCAVACPYQARHKTMRAGFAYDTPMANETKRRDDSRLAVATKCTFCVERIDDGLAQGLRPGVDPETRGGRCQISTGPRSSARISQACPPPPSAGARSETGSGVSPSPPFKGTAMARILFLSRNPWPHWMQATFTPASGIRASSTTYSARQRSQRTSMGGRPR